MKKLLQRLKSIGTATREAWLNLGLGALLLIEASSAQASFLAQPICRVFKQLAGNDLYSALAGLGGVGLLAANAMNEGDNKVKTAALRIAAAAGVLINLENITTMVTGSGWGC